MDSLRGTPLSGEGVKRPRRSRSIRYPRIRRLLRGACAELAEVLAMTQRDLIAYNEVDEKNERLY